MRARWRMPLLAGTALLAGLTAAGGTFAFWTADSGRDAVTITSGDLQIEADGDPVWTLTSPDVTAAPHTIDPATYLVRQGDTVQVTYQFSTHLQGENMLGQIEADWAEVPGLPSGVTGTYTLQDSAHTELATAPLGTSAVLDDAAHRLEADDAGRTDSYTLTIDLDFADLADRFGADSVAQLTDLGTVDVELHQVRTGVGFQ